MNARWKISFAMLLAFSLPAKMFACPACGSTNGQIDSPLADGMNWGILTLFAVLGTVLGTFLTFLIHIIRKGETLAAAQNNSADALKV